MHGAVVGESFLDLQGHSCYIIAGVSWPFLNPVVEIFVNDIS